MIRMLAWIAFVIALTTSVLAAVLLPSNAFVVVLVVPFAVVGLSLLTRRPQQRVGRLLRCVAATFGGAVPGIASRAAGPAAQPGAAGPLPIPASPGPGGQPQRSCQAGPPPPSGATPGANPPPAPPLGPSQLGASTAPATIMHTGPRSARSPRVTAGRTATGAISAATRGRNARLA